LACLGICLLVQPLPDGLVTTAAAAIAAMSSLSSPAVEEKDL